MCSRAAHDVTPRPSLCKRSAATETGASPMPWKPRPARVSRHSQRANHAQKNAKRPRQGPQKRPLRTGRVCHGSDQPPRGGRKTIKRNAPALYKTEHLPMLARCMTCAYHLPPPHGPGGGRELKNMLARNGGSRPVSAASVPTRQSTQGVLFLKDANASFRKTLLYRMENVTKLWIRFPRYGNRWAICLE